MFHYSRALLVALYHEFPQLFIHGSFLLILIEPLRKKSKQEHALYIFFGFMMLLLYSGQAAVITPRQVMLGLGSRRVKVVAAAKHHTVIATEAGEVFTWGSNRG